jgi:uncharacterized membrane protein YkvA (DUF1232 family)
MEWWDWLGLALILAAIVSYPVYRFVRNWRRARRLRQLTTSGKVRFAREVLRSPATPLPAKLIAGLLVGYLILPLDLIPDFIPVVGHLDDTVVAVAAFGLLLRLVPRAAFEAALAEAEAYDRERHAGRSDGSPLDWRRSRRSA